MMIQPKNPSANIRLPPRVGCPDATGLAEEHESAAQGESDERDPEQPLLRIGTITAQAMR